MSRSSSPPREAFNAREREIIETHRTPAAVQRYLRTLPYNWEREGRTLRSFREVVARGTAHCLEAALAAAVIMEQHGYPPLLLDLVSKDGLDHVVFIFQERGLWGAVGRSRDTGLHGRRAVFRSIRQLAWSYHDPYVDLTGRIVGYGVAHLSALGGYDWRFSARNIWKVSRHLYAMPHRKLVSSERRYRQLLARFREFRRQHPEGSPTYFADRDKWL